MGRKLSWEKSQHKNYKKWYERRTNVRYQRSDRRLGFGKYANLTPDEIMETDIKYYEWLITRPYFKVV